MGTKTFTREYDGFTVTFDATEYRPAKTYGPPENCSPEEGGEVELLSVKYNGTEILDTLTQAVQERLIELAQEEAPELFAELNYPNED